MPFTRALRVLAGLVTGVALLTSGGVARADGGGGHLEQIVDGYQVELIFGDSLRPGVVPVQVQLLDAAGQPVPAAKVQVVQTLNSALNAGGHGAAEEETHGEAEIDAQGDPEAEAHAAGDDAHEEVSEEVHGAAADAHASDDDHAGDAADSHAATEDAEAAADAHDEAVPHSHDDSSLYQLAWEADSAAYTGSVIFFEAGQWGVHVEFQVEGAEHVAEFAVDVTPADPGGLVLAGFAGLNAAVLVTAAVLKRKSAAAGGAGAA